MNENMSNPTDQELAIMLADLNRKVDSLSLVNQPVWEDWQEVDADITIESVEPRVFSFTDGLDPSLIFALGDPVRWKEDSGVFQFGYIYEVSTTTFTLINDNFSTSPTAVITDLYRGNKRSPIGHPFIFHNESTVANGDFTPDFSGTISVGVVGVDWWMEGASIRLIASTLGTGNAALQVSSISGFLNMRMPWFLLTSDPEASNYVNFGSYKDLIVDTSHEICYATTYIDGSEYGLTVVMIKSGGWGTGTYPINFAMTLIPYSLS